MITYPSVAEGVQTRILQGGSQGPVVLLLHGLSARADRWKHNLDTLGASGVRAMAIDLPGHGLAGKGAGFDYSATGYSRWLEAFVSTLGVERVVMVGTSFGGLVAAHYAANYPHRIYGLMAVGAIGLVPAGIERRKKTIAWLKEMQRPQIAARMRRGVLDSTLITEELIDEDWHINNSPGAAESFSALGDYYRDKLDDDAAAPLVAPLATHFPIRLVWGAEDPSVSCEYGRQAHQIISGSRLDFIPSCGHFPYWEKPDAFNEILLGFLRECTQGASA